MEELSEYQEAVQKAAESKFAFWMQTEAGDDGSCSRKWCEHYTNQAIALGVKPERDVRLEIRDLAVDMY